MKTQVGGWVTWDSPEPLRLTQISDWTGSGSWRAGCSPCQPRVNRYHRPHPGASSHALEHTGQPSPPPAEQGSYSPPRITSRNREAANVSSMLVPRACKRHTAEGRPGSGHQRTLSSHPLIFVPPPRKTGLRFLDLSQNDKSLRSPQMLPRIPAP